MEAVHHLQVDLAGGLDPENVAGAILLVRPVGVDVNSGVENPGGAKNSELMTMFVDEAAAVFASMT